jgi:hypothetical protein
VYQGVSRFSALAAGTFVDMDGAIQSDGSLLATRIAVEDPLADLSQLGTSEPVKCFGISCGYRKVFTTNGPASGRSEPRFHYSVFAP